jgi:hypothetical protein
VSRFASSVAGLPMGPPPPNPELPFFSFRMLSLSYLINTCTDRQSVTNKQKKKKEGVREGECLLAREVDGVEFGQCDCFRLR